MRTMCTAHVRYLDDDLLIHTVSAVKSFDDVVRAAVLQHGVAQLHLPFKHADHKFAVQ